MAHRELLKARDATKDQSYFLAAVDAEEFRDVLFPLGELTKSEVRDIARKAGLPVADKKDSTGICFIGERPFAEFLAQYLPPSPGKIVDERGRELGERLPLATHTFHGLDLAVPDREDRLDVQQRAREGRRLPDAATALQELERVDREQEPSLS